jgi:hypothetical protein
MTDITPQEQRYAKLLDRARQEKARQEERRPSPKTDKRNRAIYRKRKAGVPHQGIADEYGLTIQAVEQIYRRQDMKRFAQHLMSRCGTSEQKAWRLARMFCLAEKTTAKPSRHA